MAIVVGKNTADTHSFVIGDRVMLIIDVKGDSSYPTNGTALTASSFGLDEIHHIQGAEPTGTYLVAYDAANQKLKAFSALGTEVTNTTNLSAKTFRCLVIGRGRTKVVT